MSEAIDKALAAWIKARKVLAQASSAVDAAVLAEAPWKIGDVVEAVTGERAVITRVYPHVSENRNAAEARWAGFKVRKSGLISNQRIHTQPWQLEWATVKIVGHMAEIAQVYGHEHT